MKFYIKESNRNQTINLKLFKDCSEVTKNKIKKSIQKAFHPDGADKKDYDLLNDQFKLINSSLEIFYNQFKLI